MSIEYQSGVKRKGMLGVRGNTDVQEMGLGVTQCSGVHDGGCAMLGMHQKLVRKLSMIPI